MYSLPYRVVHGGGGLTPYPEIMLPCHTQCFVCDKTIDKYICPVVHDEAIRFMDRLPWELTLNNCGEFIDLLAADADWKSRVFGIASVKKFSCNSFFYSCLPQAFSRLDGKMERLSLSDH